MGRDRIREAGGGSPRGLSPATAYQRRPVRLANSVLRGLARLGVGRADLSEEGLVQAARRATGLHHFGDESFRVPMRVLLRSIEEEADLNPIGRMLTRQSLVRILRHRLWAQDLFDRHPEILERRLAPPVVIVGLARTGTTKLHRLLACDPRFHSLRAWESLNPVPWPESFGAERDPRIAVTQMGLRIVLYMSPQIAQVHPLAAEAVEEEIGLIEHAFSSQLFEITRRIPSFASWLMTHDQRFAYEYMARLLKLTEWFRGEEPGPWLLKSPQHMQDLDALLAVFPGARIVCTHRDPLKTLGSACSMAWISMVRDSDRLDPHWVGREWSQKTASMLDKTLRIRDSRPPEQFLDVLFADVMKDPLCEIRRIYRFIGWDLTPPVESSMLRWLDENPQHVAGAHRYRLEDFGLDAEAEGRRFVGYRERFAIPGE